MKRQSAHIPVQPTINNDVNHSPGDKDPRSVFLGAILSMSWQLAIVVLIPVIGGFKLDEHYGTSPLWTIIGFVLALGGIVAVFKQMLRDIGSNNSGKKGQQ